MSLCQSLSLLKESLSVITYFDSLKYIMKHEDTKKRCYRKPSIGKKGNENFTTLKTSKQNDIQE